ncbi:LOW QUALITY PROTEIN: hypothetical protein IFM46972_08431 [Aspergillus udagawae]|uniref:Uncharacterized protein n=1 Tax=Aspergillus udagawae TaxID=91492 RepID=A0A8H3S5L5_9EURO|nr:LOW QUALITY PROTEIN: hypothetical protein IFM46972_08431 [Aspergillus udagawae]
MTYSSFSLMLYTSTLKILHDHDRHIQRHNDHIDDDQLHQDPVRAAIRIYLQQRHRFVDIQPRKQQFLQTEADELYALHDVECGRNAVRPGQRIRRELERRAGGVQHDPVDDDQCSQGAAVIKDEIQPRPEDERLPRDHSRPADIEDGDLEEVVCKGDAVDLEDVAEAEGDDAEGGHEEGPEVGAGVALEGVEAEHDQVDGVAPGDGDEGWVDILLDDEGADVVVEP